MAGIADAAGAAARGEGVGVRAGSGLIQVISVPADNGFSWADAGIGGLVASGLLLRGGATLLSALGWSRLLSTGLLS
jgi:hypothetical protein